ncbi:putative cardiolipin-specific deacylase, mitochondrial [Cyphellophora attinorum]|uniref:Putative cardiolipin-specific deacylase, mitochondrial n=1 Tax=Cyphellophora attinorum TaxID=1664694 RepID=A0A0N0NHQ2_9EURO|nr:putative cardiolipin-specific deacylase, mitochondrial [Phialophora attinorum]KPI34828.1 putative cardiolipin-specific deacylase, mitochondrial [Phialophora attinorum]
MSSTADSDNEANARSQQSPLARQRAAERGERGGGWFPMGYKEGFSQWWSALPAAQTENKVLSYIPYLQKPPTHTQTGSKPPSVNPSITSLNTDPSAKAAPVRTNSITDPYGPRTWYSRMVELSGKHRALNEFSVEHPGEKADENLVIIHGYGAGLGFFYKNFEALSRPKGWQLYALDMLGMGRSSRPPFRIKAKGKQQQITEAEDWFIDSLEEWRVKRKIDKMTLVGHSMGGYMAVCYALKYPGHLNKLILASPVGIPEDPYATQAAMPEPQTSTFQNEFAQDAETETTKQADGNNFLNQRKKADKAAQEAQQAPNANRLPADGKEVAPRRRIPKWVTWAWDANISPFSFVRWSGPFGPRLVSGWTSRRFSHLPEAEAAALHDYAYSLFRLRGSGEYALAYILAPGAFARSPLIHRIGRVGRGTLPDGSNEGGVPVVLMYGENDWMDVKGGYAAKKLLDKAREKALQGKTEAEKREDQGGAKVVIVKGAGHHVYLDSPDEFNAIMKREMDDTAMRSKGNRKGSMAGVEVVVPGEEMEVLQQRDIRY